MNAEFGHPLAQQHSAYLRSGAPSPHSPGPVPIHHSSFITHHSPNHSSLVTQHSDLTTLHACALPSPTAYADAAARLIASRADRAGEFALEHNLPSLEFAETVWHALIHLGRDLPDEIRPGPPRPWQGSALELLIGFPRASLQAARQAGGKTFVGALVICCHLLLGRSVTIAMPTYRQGSSILAGRVLLFMQLLEEHLALKRLSKNMHAASSDNGARLFTLSTSSGGRRGTQGWTASTVVIDESHELSWADLAWFHPLVALAMKQHSGRLLLLGVGASDTRAPGRARLHPEYAHLVLDDATIAQVDAQRRARLPASDPELAEDSWADFFAAERSHWDEELYRQFYMCEAPGSGKRKIFDRVNEVVGDVGTGVSLSAVGTPVRASASGGLANSAAFLTSGPTADALTGVPTFFLGVDVGKIRDQTVIAVLEQRVRYYNLIDVVRLPLGMPYTQQARELATLARQWHCPPARFTVEVNGPGQALYDTLTDSDHPAIWCASPLLLTKEVKQRTVFELAADARRGRFGVAEIPLEGRKVSESMAPVGQVFGAAGGTPAYAATLGRADHLATSDYRPATSNSLAGLHSVGRNISGPAARSPLLGGLSIRSHLAALTQESTDDGVLSFEHSDILSALIVAHYSMTGITSLA